MYIEVGLLILPLMQRITINSSSPVFVGWLVNLWNHRPFDPYVPDTDYNVYQPKKPTVAKLFHRFPVPS